MTQTKWHKSTPFTLPQSPNKRTQLTRYTSYSQENLPEYSRNYSGKAKADHHTEHFSPEMNSMQPQQPVKINKKVLQSHQSKIENQRPLSSSCSTLKPHLLTPSLIGRPPISNIGAKTKLRTFISPAAVNQKKNKDLVLKMILKKPFARGDGYLERSNEQLIALAYASTGKSAPKKLEIPKIFVGDKNYSTQY